MWKPLFMIASLSGATVAQATDFTAWQGTRWLLEVEEAVPVPLELSAVQNLTFRTKGIQIRAVIDCNTVEVLNKKSATISCLIEDIAFQATPRSLDGDPEQAWKHSHAVLEDMVARTQGKTLEFTLNHKGKLLRVDVPDIEARNEYERTSREVIRQLATDLVSGWDLEHNSWEGTWPATQTWLMRVPNRPVGLSAGEIVHRATNVEGDIIVQTIGRGTFTTSYEPWELQGKDKLVRTRTQDSSNGGGSQAAGIGTSVGGTTYGGALVSGGSSPAGTIPTERTYDGNLTSVAIIDPDLNAPKERVWALMGSATASSIGAQLGVSIWYNGRMRMLNGDEKADVGPTQLIAPLNQTVEGLAPWISIQDED
ncbi:MAG: hypothetical protein GWP91_11085 [Rhodobacterales bacterium]|nr:hypothetical protein [Rhodobacterales bacterium]